MDMMPFLLVGGIFLVIGFLISTMINALRSPTGERAEEEQVPEPFPEGLNEVFRLWQREDSGALVPEVKGTRVPSPDKITVSQHTELAAVVIKLYRWLEAARFPMPSLEEEPEAEISGSGANSSPGLKGKPVQGVGLALEEPFANSLPKASPNLNPLAPFLQRRSREAAKPVDPKEESMVAQIDEFLQAKVKGSGLAERGLRLIELPGKGMVILLDGHQFEGIEAVEDDEVRGLIQSAVAEWEKRMLGETPPPL